MAKRQHNSKPLDLTGKQQQFLEGIRTFRQEHGYAPSIREIGEFLGLSSPATVHGYKSRLEKMGLIRTGESRGLEAIESTGPADSFTLPLLGRVAAGHPIEALDHNEYVEVPSAMVGRGQHFVLAVEGDSMVEDGVLDGDRVVICKQATAENGQTVVAMIDNEATIKRYYKKNDRIELHPANKDYHTIRVEPTSEFKIEGVLRGVIRTF